MIELKPCPFCGGKAELDFAHSTFSYFCVDGTRKDSGFYYVVKCTTCNCKSGIFEDPTMAMEAWDKRAESEWIPVTERLPEGTVLATVETKMFKHKYICEAVWIPRWSKIADFDSWEDCSEYNEDEDEYYVLEGWYERIHNWDEYSFVGIEDKVIAWKPLPEPYNKVEKGT